MDKIYSTFNSYSNPPGPIYSYCPISAHTNQESQISAVQTNENKGSYTAIEKGKSTENASENKPQERPTRVLPHIVQVYQTTVTNSIKIQNRQIIQLHPITQGNPDSSYQQLAPSVQVISQLPQPVPPSHQPQVLQASLPSMQHQHQGTTPQQLQEQTYQQSNLTSSDDLETLQVGQHFLVPSGSVMVDGQSHSYYEYHSGPYAKETANCIVAKTEPDSQNASANLVVEYKQEMASEDDTKAGKRNRSKVSNPNNWACNVRKVKHQRGEAYISRRGKFVPERKVKNTKDCLKSCKLKCNEHINDLDREHIFKAFYSLNANEKKHFLLNTTERTHTKRLIKHKIVIEPRRKYSFKYFFLVRAVRYTVCKNFYLGTLAISQKPVYNVHLCKSEVNIPKPDGRGLSEASVHSISSEMKDLVRKHIMSYRTVNSKPVKLNSKRRQYLDSKLSFKQMYVMYSNKCDNDNVLPVKESMYRKIIASEFNLHFKKDKPLLCDRCKTVIKKENV